MLQIVDVKAEPLCIELNEPFGIASGAQHRADNVLVSVVLSDGSLGLGEAAPFPLVSGETQALVLETLATHGQAFLGRPSARWRPLCREARERMPTCPSAAAALETAVLDAWLRSQRCSLWAFFGGSERELVSDITLPTGDPEQARVAAERALELGFRQLKVKVGGTSLDHDLARLGAIVKAAPQASLLLDANGAFSAEEALELLRAMGPARAQVELFEQPTAKDDLDGSRRVLETGNVDVVADESARSSADVQRLLVERAVSAINIKIMKSGVLEALDMVTLAKQGGLKLMIGGMVESELAMSASACLAGGVGGFSWVDLDTPLFMRNAPLTGGFARSGQKLLLDVIEMGHGVRLEHRAC